MLKNKMSTTLNPEQAAAVHYIDGPLLVLAGAGSGKTRVITEKIVYLINTCGYKPQQIAAVTFTNKAAQEMKSRVSHLSKESSKKLSKATNTRGLMISTFHTLGLTILRQEHAQIGLNKNFSILDQEDAKSLLQQIMQRDYGDNTDLLEDIQRAISFWKNELLSPEQAQSQAKDEKELFNATLYGAYVRYFRAYNAVDFDDLILLPVQLFRKNPATLEKWQNKIRHILVDEYQDTNFCQYQLIQLLTGARANFTLVGDDDQSIYAWRGARADNFSILQKDYPILKVIKLEQNYRSCQSILRAANQVIVNNPHIFVKKLWSNKQHGHKIRVLQTKTDQDEASRVVLDLMNHRLRHQMQYQHYAILYRSNHQSRVIEQALREYAIPYQVTGSTAFFSRTEVKDCIAYLRLITNPDDDAAFLRIINTPRRELGPSTIEKLSEYAHTRQIHLLAACDELGLTQRLPERAIKNLRQFSQWIFHTSAQLTERPTSDDIQNLLSDINYSTWLLDNSASPAAAERAEKNIASLLTLIEKMLKDEDQTLSGVITRLALLDIIDRNSKEQEHDDVQLMTLHAAKGLEFEHVYLIGMEEELLPHRNSMEEQQIEEERRLTYVGMTRAKRSLTFTLSSVRKRYNEQTDALPSRFLSEIAPEELEWEGKDEPSAEENLEKGEEHLAYLQNMLKGYAVVDKTSAKS